MLPITFVNTNKNRPGHQWIQHTWKSDKSYNHKSADL